MNEPGKPPRSKWQKFRQKDSYVREAARLGVRSRSYFKLEELDRHFGLLKNQMTVLDLGASPGGWSQYARSKVGAKGKVVAVDMISMKPVKGVHFLQYDLASQDSAAKLIEFLGPQKANVVLSDMAPNITGNSAIDSRNYFDLYDAIFKISHAVLADSGSLVFKFFQTDETSVLKEKCLEAFGACRIYKPKSSRATSQESYIVAKGFQTRST